MLHSILIFTDGGNKLFHKDFISQLENPRMISNLLRTIVGFSKQSTGMVASYIEMKKLSVTIVTDPDLQINCALFYDKEDGPEFGNIIGHLILESFKSEFREDNFTSIIQGKYNSFYSKIPEVVRRSVHPILTKLEHTRGIKTVLLIEKTTITYENKKIDQLGVAANISALDISGSDLMGYKADTLNFVTINGEDTILNISKIENAVLVVCSKKSVNSRVRIKAIEEAIGMLKKIYSILSNLDSSGKTIKD
ncbi:hypothetical protein M0813_26131 [Anaeramoeba flamelloides]|uniref:Uncharacterized protein n=1 Tax=Anaeramoeba flamelloides TaxID=1746091 RepID=A0AAV7Z4R7_9EUKA|nr:hypothetical protein M0812_18067 [Anaeramoeba flamelloides]KAJ6238164.1 hypothetical protein M0813_26131 [Anaeramoeba flamelloides]|eukprot:Anaeramoba_flamelloidesa326109_34.p1 GENE.a326109_34~~a326109_34.p1  ORF type:complete len:251 (+),score=49.47 a326109_34:111-863(+)